MNQCDRIERLAKTDFDGAFKLAHSMSDVRERIQSLGWVARYAPSADIARVIDAAKNSAGKSIDLYPDTMALAWPLRALHESGNGKRIPPLMKIAVELSTHVQPAASQAEALILLIHAVLPHHLTTAAPAVAQLKSLARNPHWRVIRALVNAALLVNQSDRQTATEIAKVIPLDNKRNSTIDRISDGQTMQVRPFFW